MTTAPPSTRRSAPPSTLRSGFAWLVGGYAGRTLAFLATTLLVARTLSPADYGHFSLFMAIASGIAFVGGGWAFVAVPMLRGAGMPLTRVVPAASLLALAPSLAVALVVIPLTAATTSGGALAAYVLALIGLQAVYAVLQSSDRMRTIAVLQTGERVAVLALALVLASLGTLTLTSAQRTIAAAAVVTAVGALLWLQRSEALVDRTSLAAIRDGLRRVLRAVGPLAIVSVCGYLIAYLDLYLLPWFVSAADVGRYALAYQLFTVFLQIGALWPVAVLPRYARSARADLAHVVWLPQLLAVTLASGAAVLLTAVVGVFALPLVFGDDYTGSVGPALVLLGSVPALVGYFACVPVLIARERASTLAWISAAGVVTNLSLDLILMPSLGIWAPAIATSVQNLLVTALIVSATLDRAAAVTLTGSGVVAVGACALLAVTDQHAGASVVSVAAAAALAVAATHRARRSAALR